MTTRKHFKAAAAIISKISDKVERERSAEIQATIFASDNPRFDRKRFMIACGVE